ncbi:aspartate/glutamate racemase family protein [Enterococcus sp.]|uniref:aspartate/glutamate racemase family protein n=1 Tax=Enterococcus sp. TaxID=35783 RepID=UPI0028B06FBD|nr:aspartate/glutamate racemase family protein [Enterococcus sp.]
MKTIGLLGGMSWESTITYYQQINKQINEALGGLHSAQILLASVDFEAIEACQKNNEWEKSGEILAGYAQSLERAGADFLLICTNTMHKVAPQIQQAISIPIIHIADATVTNLQAKQIKKVALLGTTYTMTQDFYKQRVIDQGIDVLIPDEAAISELNRIIFDELCHGVIKETSKATFLRAIRDLQKRGAEGVILGCTEIGLLIEQPDVDLPVFDTTLIHAKAAVELALS